MVRQPWFAVPLASLGSCTIGEEAALGLMISGIRLSGLVSEDKESYLLRVSREAVISNNDVEEFGIQQFMNSHTIVLPQDLFRILHIVNNMPFL